MIDPTEKITTVTLTEPNPEWITIFNEAAVEIRAILNDLCLDIHHIGSTAIPGIYAKPIIDILPA